MSEFMYFLRWVSLLLAPFTGITEVETCTRGSVIRNKMNFEENPYEARD